MAITQEQTVTSVTTSTSPSITFTSTPTSGNLLLAIVTCGASVTTPPSGWTGYPYYNAAVGTTGLYYKISAGTEGTVAWTLSDNSYTGMSLFEYSGMTATPTDQNNTAVDAATQQLVVAASGENAQADSLCVVAALVYDDDVILTDSAGWVEEHLITEANWMNQYVGTRVTTALETPSNTLDLGGGENKEMQAVISVFKASAGAPNPLGAIISGVATSTSTLKQVHELTGSV